MNDESRYFAWLVIHPVISLHVNPFEPFQSGGGAANIELPPSLFCTNRAEPARQRVSGVNARPRPVLIRMISDRSSAQNSPTNPPTLIDHNCTHSFLPNASLNSVQLMEHRIAGIIDQNKWYMDAGGGHGGARKGECSSGHLLMLLLLQQGRDAASSATCSTELQSHYWADTGRPRSRMPYRPQPLISFFLT